MNHGHSQWLFALLLALCVFPKSVTAYSISDHHRHDHHHHHHYRDARLNRRAALGAAGSMATLSLALPVIAATTDNNNSNNNSNSNNKPVEFQNVGQQAPVPDSETAPFRTLPNGVQIKDFRLGTGDATATTGSKVALQITGRLLNLNGIVFYDSKKNDPDGLGGIPVTFTVGDGTAIPGLSFGVAGMKKGGIRRIIVPPELGYNPTATAAASAALPLLEPIPVNAMDQRALDSVIYNPRRDATLLLDVKLERIK